MVRLVDLCMHFVHWAPTSLSLFDGVSWYGVVSWSLSFVFFLCSKQLCICRCFMTQFLRYNIQKKLLITIQKLLIELLTKFWNVKKRLWITSKFSILVWTEVCQPVRNSHINLSNQCISLVFLKSMHNKRLFYILSSFSHLHAVYSLWFQSVRFGLNLFSIGRNSYILDLLQASYSVHMWKNPEFSLCSGSCTRLLCIWGTSIVNFVARWNVQVTAVDYVCHQSDCTILKLPEPGDQNGLKGLRTGYKEILKEYFSTSCICYICVDFSACLFSRKFLLRNLISWCCGWQFRCNCSMSQTWT